MKVSGTKELRLFIGKQKLTEAKNTNFNTLNTLAHPPKWKGMYVNITIFYYSERKNAVQTLLKACVILSLLAEFY